ncbi:MAG TPA: carboxypeptidase-like regulatory domain-containing protein [Pyrinomonadaceae bacterium]|nr:carboxypeptidase-like regulatory domain-containing protein [Pyrinomonadaceae bacterium]
MYRKPALLLFSCMLVAGASGIGKTQGPIAQAHDFTSPSPIRQTGVRGRSENGKGSISGRAVNEHGEPVVGLVVFVVYGRRGAHPHLGVQTGLIETDKEGRFHVPDLAPGEYIVSVTRPCCREADSIPPDEANEAPYYKEEVTYYKDTPDRKDAVPVQVKANMETAGLEITWRRRPLYKVSGTVFNRDGQPLPGARLSMIRKQKPNEPPYSAGVSTEADAQGKWSFEVPDGVYIVNAFNVVAIFEDGETVSGFKAPSVASPPGPRQISRIPYPKSVSNVPAQPRQVSVSAADVPDVIIDMNQRAQIISGRVVLEDGSPIPSEATIDVDIGSDWNSKPIAIDGSFELKGPSLGQQFLSVISQPFGKYYIKSITCSGTDYMQEAFEFGNGMDYRGVEVVLSPRGTLLEGSVRMNRAAARVTTGQVWLIPEDETKWRAPLTWFSSRIYEDGTFTIYAAPGDYLLIVDESDNHGFGPYDLDRAEDYVRERAPRVRHITLKAGERNSVRL